MTLPLVDDASIAALVDDTGVGTDGSVVNKAMLEAIAEAVDAAIYDSASLQTPKETTVEVVAARGTLDSLNERISGVIDEDGAFIGFAGFVDIAGTAGEDLPQNTLAYLSKGLGGKTAGLWYKTNATLDYASSDAEVIGLTVEAVLSGSLGLFRREGRVSALSGLVAGGIYYVSDTPGNLAAAPGTNTCVVGIADTSTTLVLTMSARDADVLALLALTHGAAGSKATIDDRLDVSLAADGYLVNPYPKPIVHTGGTGTATGRAPLLFDGIVAAQPNVGAALLTAWTATLPGNSLDTNKGFLRLKASGTCAANANVKTITFVFGATTVTVKSSAFGSNAVVWACEIIVKRRSGTTQVITSRFQHSQLGSTGAEPVIATAAETLSGNVTVALKVQATSNNDIIVEDVTVELWA